MSRVCVCFFFLKENISCVKLLRHTYLIFVCIQNNFNHLINHVYVRLCHANVRPLLESELKRVKVLLTLPNNSTFLFTHWRFILRLDLVGVPSKCIN